MAKQKKTRQNADGFGMIDQVHQQAISHGENGGTLAMVPLIINPIYTLYSGWVYPLLKGSLEG